MSFHVISQVPLFCSAIHSMIETHKRKERNLSREAAAPELPELLCELREFCWGVIKDRNTSPWEPLHCDRQSPWKEGVCVVTRLVHLCKTHNYSGQCKSETGFLCFFPNFLELTDFRLLENSKEAKDASCLAPATSISQALLQQQGHNKISYYFFIQTAEKDNHTSRILSCLYQQSFAHFLHLRLKEQHGRTDMGPSVRIWLLGR